jgi:hypothetical protein
LKGPIRFTPADPEHSRRQFYFSDVSALDKKGRLKHDRQTVDVEMAVQGAEGRWQRMDVRLHFSAPRLLRDQLNNTTGQDAAATSSAIPWRPWPGSRTGWRNAAKRWRPAPS